MLGTLGWLLIAAGVLLAARLFASRRARVLRTPTPDTQHLTPFLPVLALAAGAALLAWSRVDAATLRPVELTRPDDWAVGGPQDAIRWENGALRAKLVVESDSFAAFPVDWRGGRFRAEWDMRITQLDLRREWGERASIAIGVFDGTASNIDDPDHVGEQAIEATFSDDVRLRASDEDRLLKTASATELSVAGRARRDFQASAPVTLRLDTPYHCVLTYDGRSDSATLQVSDAGRPLVTRRLEDLPDYGPSVAWFGVTVRGFKHRNKAKEAALKSAYSKPAAEVILSNLRYSQS